MIKHFNFHTFEKDVVQLLSCGWLLVTPWTVAHQASLSITVTCSLLRLMAIELMMPSNHLILCCPLLLLPSIFLSIRVYSNESTLGIRWPEYWSFSFSISAFNEYLGLISFRIDWFDLLAVQGLSRVFSRTTVQKHQSFSAQPSLCFNWKNDYWKNHSFGYMHFCWQSYVSAFNMLSRFVIVFLPRSKHLFISWLQSLSAVILESKKIKWDYLFSKACLQCIISSVGWP